MQPASSSAQFTRRQREVIHLVALGHTAAEIGPALGISARTARAHIDAVRAKLGVPRRRLIPAAYRHLTGLDPLAIDFAG